MRVLVLFLLCVSVSAAERPNILYVYLDDLGWGSLGPNGQFARREANLPALRTPNLDRLAREGINFRRAYGCTVCSPARSSQQTGFHQGHTFADRNDPDNARKAIRADDESLGARLSAAGYATGYWGKWGYGGSRDLDRPQIVNHQTLPTAHGYAQVLAELHHVRAHTFFQPTLWRDSTSTTSSAVGGMTLVPNTLAAYRDSERYPLWPAQQNHPSYPKVAYCDDHYALAALDFVRQRALNYRETGQPFFGLLAVQVPHAPFAEVVQLPEWDAAYGDDPNFAQWPPQAQQWAAMVSRLDGHLGNLLRALDDPNGDGDKSDSVAAQTLVIVQSDNGGPNHAAREVFAANGGLRGAKGQIYEGGIRVPTLMRWSARVRKGANWEPGTTTDFILDVTDILPTLCRLAGVKAPVGVDGVSFAETLLGQGKVRQRPYWIHEAGRRQSILRGDHKLVRSPQGLALYDLAKDRAELHDISQELPDLVAELERLLLGERVAEPKGFANTYHRWRGADGADVDVAGHWSDYVYENEGIVYLEDRGLPRTSWIAHLNNESRSEITSRATSDVAFLGLEIGGIGGSGGAGGVRLVVEEGGEVSGRNEFRVAERGSVDLRGGAVSSARWVEILPGGALSGYGRVESTLYQSGLLRLPTTTAAVTLAVRGDFIQEPSARLVIELGERVSKLMIQGRAELAGALQITGTHGLESGTVVSILEADAVVGRFSNPGDRVRLLGGPHFEIEYGLKEVKLVRLP